MERDHFQIEGYKFIIISVCRIAYFNDNKPVTECYYCFIRHTYKQV